MGRRRRNVGLAITWVFLGALLIVGLSYGLSYLFLAPLTLPLSARIGQFLGKLIATALLTSLSFFVGGMFVGILSPGETIREPGLASMFAMGLMTLIRVAVEGEVAQPTWIFLTAALGYGVGMLGGWIGEMIQSRYIKGRRPHHFSN